MTDSKRKRSWSNPLGLIRAIADRHPKGMQADLGDIEVERIAARYVAEIEAEEAAREARADLERESAKLRAALDVERKASKALAVALKRSRMESEKRAQPYGLNRSQCRESGSNLAIVDTSKVGRVYARLDAKKGGK